MSFGLQYRDLPPSLGSKERPGGLVLLHGYGSNELDLLTLGEAIDPSLHVISVRAPLGLGPEAFAWFSLDWSTGIPIPDEEEAVESRDLLVEFLKDVPDKFGVEPGFTLGGFSQGAMMSCGIALQEPSLVKRVLMMSGRALPAFTPAVRDQRLQGVKALVQHGVNDPVLSFQGSRDAAALLTAFGAIVTHREYPMAHEVSQASLIDIRNWFWATKG